MEKKDVLKKMGFYLMFGGLSVVAYAYTERSLIPLRNARTKGEYLGLGAFMLLWLVAVPLIEWLVPKLDKRRHSNTDGGKTK